MATAELLSRFIQSFQRAVSGEMDAMRASLGPFEVMVRDGRAAGLLEEDGPARWLYEFSVAAPNDKLAVGLECSLRCGPAEHLVTLTRLDGTSVQLSSPAEVSLTDSVCTLVLYPWFLYERLQVALGVLADAEGLYPRSALRLFGKCPPALGEAVVALPHGELNESQRSAVELCGRSDLAFVWGPPGTGKTVTLGHLVTELLHQGYRVLVTSTTNAAVDQALAKLAALPEAAPYLDACKVVRIGQVQGQSFGASLGEVRARLNRESQQLRKRLEEQRARARQAAGDCAGLLGRLEATRGEEQIDLFAPRPVDPGIRRLQEALFSPCYAGRLAALAPQVQALRVGRRKARLDRVAALCQVRLEELGRAAAQQEVLVVRQARVILATMTNVYLSRLLSSERFDVVIVEEAGMAILPVLFYCAALARDKVIMVGDPRQLPPIVQSRDPYVRQAMGRSIFEVTVPDPWSSETVVMLDVQYRMHPAIGQLVSEVFYEGRLRHGAETGERAHVAALRPFPDEPLVVVDTRGTTSCSTHGGSFSRTNEGSAHLCVDLALEAAGDGLDSIAVITPYVEQARLIRKLLAAAGERARPVECSTVHRFQGNERDLVVLDTVDAEPLAPGVLLAGRGRGSDAAHLLNVSISRARAKLVLVADVAYFEARAPDSLICRLLRQAIRAGRAVPTEAG